MTYLNFKDPISSDILLEWWRNLDNFKGDRAMLRRCNSYEEVAFSPSFHRLRKELRNKELNVNNERLAIVAGVVSHVKNSPEGINYPELMATAKKKGEDPQVSERRFEKLLSIDNPENLYSSMIRFVKLTGGSAPIPDLAHGLYWWNNRTKKEWALAYYEKIV